MIKFPYIILLFAIGIFFITENNYFNIISNNDFTNMITNNSTLYKVHDKLCLLNYTDFLANSHYYCANYIEPVVQKINITNNKVLSLNYNTHEFFSFWNIFIILSIYTLYNFLSNLKKMSFGADSSDIVVKKSDTENKSKSDTEIQTIDNFIGCSNIKKDINELITQIKFHNIFSSNDCNLPKGVLLLGPPGCGKTHLVRTIINATKINYIFTSGSDFNKIFVGSGTQMLNQIFTKARENKPCLIFIDEADALIKKRNFSDSSAVSTEFGSSLCKLLAELDSIKTEAGIVVVFATNMNEKYIDPALMRAGRVDKILHITEPTFEERKQLFKMYLKELYDDSTVDLDTISKLSSGLTGSDIKKIVNSLRITKINSYISELQTEIEVSKTMAEKIKIPFNFLLKHMKVDLNNLQIKSKITYKINTREIDNEINKCIMGLERERPINQINKKLIAFHEAGHAIMSFLLKDTKLPTKICISITSKTLGYTMYLNDEEDLIMNTSINNLMREIMILYSGRSAENIFMNEITCGAEDDYLKARKILKRLVLNGMLVPEINLISDTNEDKIPENVEKIMSKINSYLIKKIELELKFHEKIVSETAELIILNSSITGDDIEQIFIKNNMGEYIHSVVIEKIITEIKNDILLLEI
jgi:cell division protease FtsH